MKIINWIKKDTVLFAALLLAALSVFFVKPDREYLSYIDYRTIAILFSLMAVMAGFKEIGVFGRLAEGMLRRTKSLRQVILVLLLLCFFFSMLITNDVALITFVPLTIMVLDMLGEEAKKRWLIPVVVMQTIAANLGSMLTPVGNPQNLYLYGISGMSFPAFLRLMLPYTGVSFVLILLWCMLGCRGGAGAASVAFSEEKKEKHMGKIILYAVLFLICLLSVLRLIPYYVPLVLVFVSVLAVDRKVLGKVDYPLLLTFCGFFVFIGNMGRVEAFCALLESVISGHEVMTAVISSQAISNVPAALLLSGFTDDCRALIIGTNLGGLGTLIASMASLISFKYIAAQGGGFKGRYLLYFTVANILFLAVLLGCHFLPGLL